MTVAIDTHILVVLAAARDLGSRAYGSRIMESNARFGSKADLATMGGFVSFQP